MKFKTQTLITIENLPKIPAAKVKEIVESIYDSYGQENLKYLGAGKIVCGTYTTHQTDYILNLISRTFAERRSND